MKNSSKKLLLGVIWVSVLCGCSNYNQSNQPPAQVSEIIDSTVKASGANENTNVLKNRPQPPSEEVNLTSDSSGKWRARKQKLGQDDLIGAVFVNEKYGWLISNDELTPESGKIYKTANGGNSWLQQPLKLPPNSFISRIFFIDEDRGWLVIQIENHDLKNIESEIQILETNDGGDNWKSQYSLKNAYVSDLFFDQTSGEGWLVGLKGKAEYSFKTDALALHTLDFGKNWSDVSPNFLSGNQSDSAVVNSTDSLKSIQPSGSLKAFVISRRGRLLQTSDGGKSWEFLTVISNEQRSGAFQNLESLKDSTFLVTSGSNAIDGHWSLLSVVSENIVSQKYLFNNVYIADVAISPTGELFACGIKYSFNETRDGFDIKNIVIYSKNYEKWEIIYENNCTPTNCGLNKIIEANGKYFVVGNEGTIISVERT